jgi:zinc/manganese transport system substrate-binding protein
MAVTSHVADDSVPELPESSDTTTVDAGVNHKHARAAALVTAACTAVTVLCAAGCTSSDSPSPEARETTDATAGPDVGPDAGSPDPSPVLVVTSGSGYAALVKAVGGEHVRITRPPSEQAPNPHRYSPTSGDIAAVTAADLVVANGVGHDRWLTDLPVADDSTRVVVSDVRSGDAGRPRTGAHLWYDPATVALLVDLLTARLTELRPDGEPTFRANADLVHHDLDELDRAVDTLHAEYAGARDSATDTQPAALIDALGLDDATPARLEQLQDRRKSGPPALVARALSACLTGDDVARAVLVNPDHPTALTRTLETTANQTGVPVVAFTEALPPDTPGYVDWMGLQVDELAGALANADSGTDPTQEGPP